MSTATNSTPLSTENRKLVVLGIPWDVDTEGLRQFMSKYGDLSDVIVMKDRSTGRSRGFGYVTFATSESAEKALGSSHFLNGRMLDVKVATPKEAMPTSAPVRTGGKRIFVARIPLSVTEEQFKSYFAKYGPLSDIYMPKDKGSDNHRGIGFITYEQAEPVDKIMSETHQLGGATIAVDRATPKEEGGSKALDKFGSLPYGVFNSYLNAAARLGFFMPPFFPVEYPGYGVSSEMGSAGGQGTGTNVARQLMALGKGIMGLADQSAEANPYLNKSSAYGSSASMLGASKPVGRKIFVGRIPIEVTVDEVRAYFGKFGVLLDVYLPKDKEKTTHRGFGFVTFAEESAVEQVVARTHELRGQMLAIDQAAPVGEAPTMGSFFNASSMQGSVGVGGGPGPIRGSLTASSNAGYGTPAAAGGYDYSSPWGLYSSLSASSSKTEPRYRPY